MKTILKIPAFAICIAIAACTSRAPSDPAITEGDRGAGVIVITWEEPVYYNPDYVPVRDMERFQTAKDNSYSEALRRCNAWGYTGIDPYVPTQRCFIEQSQEICRIRQNVQCTK